MRFSIFLCFFLRIRLRRFLISDPMARRTLLRDEHRPFLQGFLHAVGRGTERTLGTEPD